MMLHFPCVSLTSLSKKLGERHDELNKMIVRNFSHADLLTVENDIVRINKLITSHRRHCQHCKLRERRATDRPRSPRPVSTEIRISSINMAN
jgi:hypothetical protein